MCPNLWGLSFWCRVVYYLIVVLILAWRWCKVMCRHWVAYDGGSHPRDTLTREHIPAYPLLKLLKGGGRPATAASTDWLRDCEYPVYYFIPLFVLVLVIKRNGFNNSMFH
ncbi:hypothetical protein QBC32DRAFT_161547 [Pseudoneurospora amorphoporcata]|uniref:Uncharacterized protein n=1 Tax=Pseudoneurospora amorphoporcata TaxID=241081 RepID=A0AAN6SF86_9PEZI|nr:hypothetical protein QBC32DRAFT_161547 [Pseudoneurospora amorphoporcata]